ncbi:NKAP family protein CG6066-like [Drosophila gunungcola]|uniref:NKAP family protein CG6066-like n=1 Tax=Drosophila gunungcola TaxID=103775 RepID=UPI0022E8CA24|nr:NKAP family protein CG6066-like [Drosophila gunungcola]
MTQPKENSKTTHGHRAEKRYLSRCSSEEPEIIPSRRSRLHSREINTKTPCASPKSSKNKYRFQEDLTLAKSKNSKKSIAEHKNADSESKQSSMTQRKDNSKTTHSHRAEKRYLYRSSSEEPDIIPSRRSRLHSRENNNTKTPCASPKSSKTSYKTSKTLPNSPSPFRNIPEQKTQSVKPFPSTATNNSYCQSKIANTQNNTSAKTTVDHVRKTSKQKNQNISRTASPVPSPKRKKSKSGTADQENVAIYCEPKSESEKIKAISAIVSTLLPEQKACLARKRMMMKMAMEQKVTTRRKSLRDIR